MKIIQALSHPLRIVILGSLENKGRTRSALARMLEVNPPRLAYHLKVLRDLEMIQLIETQRQRERIYEIRRPSFSRLLPRNGDRAVSRGKASGPLFQAMVEGGLAALEAGLLDAGEAGHLSYISVALDEEGLEEVAGVIAECEARISQAKANAAKRLADGGGGRLEMTIALAAFEASE